jgi:hypothetical protein
VKPGGGTRPLLPKAAGLAQAVTASGDATVALPAEQF